MSILQTNMFQDGGDLCAAHWTDQQPGDLTPLDTKERSGCLYENLETTFRHSGWYKKRRQVRHAIWNAGASHSEITGFDQCGSSCFVVRSRTDPTQVRCAASCCHHRFCLPCAQGRSRTIAGNILPYLKQGQCRFVTLTLRHDAKGLAANIDRLYESFKKLRKTPIWKASQKGGVALLEVKRSRDGRSWHPHFHVLTQGRYMDGVKLAAAWKAITEDSFIVDIRFVADDAAVLKYVTKYASKPFDASLYDNEETLREAVIALKGRRMALTFGSWKGLQVTAKPDAGDWEKLGSLEELLIKAAKGCAESRSLIIAACGEQAEMMLRIAERLKATEPITPPEQPPDVQLFLLEPEDHLQRFLAS